MCLHINLTWRQMKVLWWPVLLSNHYQWMCLAVWKGLFAWSNWNQCQGAKWYWFPGSGAHFINSYELIAEIFLGFLLLEFGSYDPIKSKTYTCHDSSDAMACAGIFILIMSSSPVCTVITLFIKATHILQDLYYGQVPYLWNGCLEPLSLTEMSKTTSGHG